MLDELEVIAAEAMKEAKDDSSIRVYDSSAADEAAIKALWGLLDADGNGVIDQQVTFDHIT